MNTQLLRKKIKDIVQKRLFDSLNQELNYPKFLSEKPKIITSNSEKFLFVGLMNYPGAEPRGICR